MQGILTGIILMSVSVITMVASIIYLYANSISDAALLKDSVAILFLNDLDEQVYEIVSRLVPSWVERLEEEIKSYEFNARSHVSGNSNYGDRSLARVETIVDNNSVASRVEATANLLREGTNYLANENTENGDYLKIYLFYLLTSKI